MPSRLLVLLLIVSFLAPLLAAEPLSAATQRWLSERTVQRKERATIITAAEADRRDRAAKAAKQLEELFKRAAESRVAGQESQLSALITGIHSIHPDPVKGFKERLAALGPVPEAPAPAAIRAWTKVLADKRSAMTKPTEQLGQRALEAGVLGIAHQCLEQVLTIQPDHAGLRKNLRQVQIDGRWYGPREQEIAKSGLRWDQRLGWIVGKEAAQYADGRYFGLDTKQWTTMAAADAGHRTWAKPWVIKTEHLEVRGTAELSKLVEVANRLEEFYGRIFGSYSGFFAGGKGQARDVRLIFGLLDHPPLVVNVAYDKADYPASLPNGISAGWTAGMFIPSASASFFYAGPQEVLYHEFTHQILHMFTNGNQAPVWVVEGVAVYTQAPTFVDGRMVLGRLAGNSHLLHQLRLIADKKEMSIDEILDFTSYQAWSEATDPGPQYSAAGMLVQFCMEAEGRRYRDDFIDYLRDAYRGETNERAVWLYLGLDRPTMIAAYKTWQEALAKQPTEPAPSAGQ